MKFELTNSQRLYLGLEPIESHWERIVLHGDTYRDASILYFEGDTIKRHIISSSNEYKEQQYDDLTKSRTILLPKTIRGKQKKLTASVLESRQPIGVYCYINTPSRILIGNFNTQTTFYDSFWDRQGDGSIQSFDQLINEFISTAPTTHLSDIDQYKNAKRKNVKFKAGDFFRFKINRTTYGFGRILIDIDRLRKKVSIPKNHGLNFLMAKPVLVQIYPYLSDDKHADVLKLAQLTALPSGYMMDNLLLYGQFEIIGYQNLSISDLDFPMSYGRHLDGSRNSVFFQWGLIHLELPLTRFNKYLVADNPFVKEESPSRNVNSPYGYYGIGFYPPRTNAHEIKDSITNSGRYDFDKSPSFTSYFDLRNTKNKDIKDQLMKAFGLDPTKSYDENCRLVKTTDATTLLKSIQG